jgi:hypothetical protein
MPAFAGMTKFHRIVTPAQTGVESKQCMTACLLVPAPYFDKGNPGLRRHGGILN